MSLILGIDGGGSKTAAWLAEASGDRADEPLGRGFAGPSNPRAVGFAVACANLDQAIAAAFANAKFPRTMVQAACICLAGADRASEKAALENWAGQAGIATHVRITNDAEPLLAAASRENWGIALIAGTGSIAWGKNRIGDANRCGGWGYLFGDEGSGYAIAIAGLRAAARAADGRGEATRLLSGMQDRLGVSQPATLVEAVYHADIPRAKIAELAEVVFVADAADDFVARRIVAAAATDLAELVVTLARKLQLDDGDYPLALAGGLLVNYSTLRRAIAEHLQQASIAPREIAVVADPVRGAVELARACLPSAHN